MKRSMWFTSVRSAAAVVLALGGLGLLSSACRGSEAEDPSSQQYNAYNQQPGYQQPGQYQQPGYQQPGQYQQLRYQQPGQYQQPGYQQPGQYQQPGYQQPGQYQQPGTTAPATTAQPSPLALPCTSDMVCGTHKCNTAVGKCAFPCAANTDCAAGFSCMGAGSATAICVPGGQ
ncbi:hypothetical protein [Sorangium cellulosum]|uniref:hypothetical protein n=1 Tax=Sorangium cellulosum TaxID=56 RepID=UPI001F42D7BB|nr:hypothetical protein [Sorangium cellulosum]